MMKWAAILAAMALALPLHAWAGTATLLDSAQLVQVLHTGAPCCLIDARNEATRKQSPIPFAVNYREGLAISPLGFAVVIADTDQRALAVARALAAPSNGRIYAVEGGYGTWAKIQPGAAGTAPKSSMPKSFTIPSNTCEQGKPLHEFK